MCLSLLYDTQLKRKIHMLKSELKSMAEVRHMCTVLASEVSSLLEALNSLKAEVKLTSILLQPY